MAISLKNLTSTRRRHPPVLAIYGSGGIGKTSLAAEAPSPLYLFTEGEEPPTDVELPTLTNEDGTARPIQSFEELLDVFDQLLSEEHDFKTVIIDSIDNIEPMVWKHTCARMNWKEIASNEKGSPTAYGVGYLEADNDWRDYFGAIEELSRNGILVIQILHSEVKSFEDPVNGAYDRYRPKLHKRSAAMLIEKSHALLFMSKRTSLKQVDKGFGKKESVPEGMSGSERLIYTDERTGFLAKNRLNMPPSITYRKGQGYTEIAKYFYGAPANDNAAVQREAA